MQTEDVATYRCGWHVMRDKGFVDVETKQQRQYRLPISDPAEMLVVLTILGRGTGAKVVIESLNGQDVAAGVLIE